MEIPITTKIIYLDQKGWIDLAKLYYGHPTNSEKALLEKILKASDNDKAVFPISMATLSETCEISKDRWRKELASLMVNVSKYHAIRPYIKYTLELEIENLILAKLNLPLINIRKHFVEKGFARLMGGKLEATSEKIDPKVLNKINQHAANQLDRPETLEYLMSVHYENDEEKLKDLEAVETFEGIRNKLKTIKDNDIRRKASFIQNTHATIVPLLARRLYDMGAPISFVETFFYQFDVDEFLKKLPTALCLFTLLFQRDQQSERDIQVNDIADIWHLTLAIPYSDIVVTERMWASIAKRAKLDEKCNTIILPSLTDLDYLL